MSRKVSILGAGKTGGLWSRLCHRAGWVVSVFDPDPTAEGAVPLDGDWRRDDRISDAVRDADWVVVCLPERLELQQKVIERAQATAPKGAAILSASRAYDIDQIQSCAIRPSDIVQVQTDSDGGFALLVSHRNPEELKEELTGALAELAAIAMLDNSDFAQIEPQPLSKASK